MKAFTLEPRMTTMGGVFYPTGYMVLMYPTERDAHHAAALLEAAGVKEDDVSLLTPAEFERQIVGETTADDDENEMPSAGTEGDTERRFANLARQGHHALLVHAPSARESEHVMEVLSGTPISYGQKYRHLVIEDLT